MGKKKKSVGFVDDDVNYSDDMRHDDDLEWGRESDLTKPADVYYR